MKFANIFERCDSKKTKQLVVYQLTRSARLLMRKQELADFVQLFLQWSFDSIAGEEETKRTNPDSSKRARDSAVVVAVP